MHSPKDKNTGPESETEHKIPPNYGPQRKRRRSDELKNELIDFKKDIKELISSFMSASEKERNCLQKDISDIKTKIQEVQRTNTDIEKSIDFLSKQFDDVITKVDSLEQECCNNRMHIQTLQDKIDFLERSSLKSVIELRNIPGKEKENVNDLNSIVVNTGKVLKLEIEPAEIRDVLRLPGKPGSTRTILAEFTTVSTKHKYLQAARSFNLKRSIEEKLNTGHLGIAGNRTPVFISEHLTSNNRKLFHQARDFAKLHSFKFCWTSNGRIFLRKDETANQKMIKSEKCLTDLMKLL